MVGALTDFRLALWRQAQDVFDSVSGAKEQI